MKYPSSTKLCDRSKTFIILQEEKRKASSLSVFCLSEKFHSGETRIFSELKKLTSLCFAKDSKEIDCFQDFWSSQNPGQLNPRLWNSD